MATVMHSIRTAVHALHFTLHMRLQGAWWVFLAALLHDIGKAKVPGRVLNKPERLTEEEMSLVRRHAGDGADMLDGKLPPPVVEMVRYHHENVDGTGYYGVQDIPAGARVIRICDVYDSLVSRRPYKEPWSTERACAYLFENAGTLFDYVLVMEFVKLKMEGVATAKA